MTNRLCADTVRDVSYMKKVEFDKTLSVIRAEIDDMIMKGAIKGTTFIYVDIPRQYLGREPYDWTQMGKAIVKGLIEDGYHVSGTYIKFKLTWYKGLEKALSKKTLINVPSF